MSLNETPYLISTKCLKPEYENLKRINISSENFTLGRNLSNSAVVPFLSISRNHCIIKKTRNNDWILEDQSTFGIKVNGNTIGKGMSRRLAHNDCIILEPTEEFIYKFVNECDDFEIPKKRIKLEKDYNDDLINDVKLKFEESQSYERQHLEEKIQSLKQMQSTQKMLKDQLQSDMNRKIKQLESEFEEQIENLKGEKSEVERQKALLIGERDAQLASVRNEMEGKIVELMEQIQKHNETESELMKENNLLKEKLLKEREDFLAELNRESSSKQDMLDKLNEKMREQEEIRQKEREELEEKHRKENELLRLAKEEEIKVLEEQKRLREQELIKELAEIKSDMETRIKVALEQQQQLNQQVEEMKKLSNEDKAQREELAQVREREIELAALAAARIQQQADQSSEVITSLQEQLEKMRSQLKEKNTLLENLCLDTGEGTSKQTAQNDVGDLIENELQCSICSELFITATTLNCSHTFCKYCITMWKKKKKDCPICRAPITSECKSIVLDSLIEKSLERSEESKKKREEILKAREELESELPQTSNRERRGRGSSYSPPSDVLVEFEGSNPDEYEDEDEYYGSDGEYDEYDYYTRQGGWRRHPFDSPNYDDDVDSETDSDSGSDVGADPPAPAAPLLAADGAPPADLPPPPTAAADSVRAAAGVPNNTTERSDSVSGRRSRRVRGLPGAYYGGYGRCFRCGNRGHWAPGCPFR